MSKAILAATFSGVLAMFALTPVAKADHCCCDSGYSLGIYSSVPVRSYGIQPYNVQPYYGSYQRVPSYYYYSAGPRPYYYGYPSYYGYPYYGSRFGYYGSGIGYYGSGIGIGIGIGGHSYSHHGFHGHHGHH